MANDNLKFINVLEDSFSLYDYCKKYGLTDYDDYEDFYQSGGDLQFFEGDPDMIKVDGETGFFAKCGDIVFYWFDDLMTHKAESILRGFFGAFRVGITLGGESYMRGELPKGCSDANIIQNWDAWEKMRCGIAYRGGAGYTYTIQSWGNYLRYAA